MTHPHSWDAYPVPDNLPPAVINDPALPLVSIVTPSYNQGHFIRQTIESVLTQDYANIEYWVIDGGSTDETVSILREYEHDPRFHWITEKDRGQSDAINKGWSRCRGKIVAWLNSDDTYLPHAIRSQVNYLQENPGIDIVYGDCVYTNQQGIRTSNAYGRKFHFLELLRFTVPYQPTVFLTRKAILCGGPLDLSFHYSLDSEYWLRLHKLGLRFGYNPGLIATYRLHDSSKTVADILKIHADHKRLIELYAPPEHYPRLLSDLYLQVAIHLVERKKVRESFQYVTRALAFRPTKRVLSYLAILGDQATGIPFYRHLLDYWMKLRRGI